MEIYPTIQTLRFAVNPDAKPEEIDEAIESGDTQIFAKAILDKERKQQAVSALKYVENKSNDIKRLEQSILELHNLFLDMAILVEAQGELIDQIEYNVTQAVDNTKSAVENLRGANKYQRKSRKVIL
jgi:t-SNARE complex subunit (syntaxin)